MIIVKQWVVELDTMSRKYLIVPVGEGHGLLKETSFLGMLISKGVTWTGFLLGDTGAGGGGAGFHSSIRESNLILMFVLGKRTMHL